MKSIKFFLFIILISAGFLFNGELYMLYQDNFEESYYQADFYAEMAGEEKPEQIVDTFENTGEKFDVDFFVVDRKFASTFDTTVTVYGTDKVKEELREKGVLRDKAKSIFFGTTEVQFVPFSQIGDITKYENFYFLGDESDMAQMRGFKAELIDRYGGGFPKQFGNDQELWLNLLLVWSIIAGLVLGVTGCSCLYQKKENMVKVILGEKPGQLFIRNSLEDTVLLTTLFLIIPYLLAPLTNTYFKYSFSMIVLWGILLINLLLHTTVLRMRYKRDLSGSYSEKGLLPVSYTHLDVYKRQYLNNSSFSFSLKRRSISRCSLLVL